MDKDFGDVFGDLPFDLSDIETYWKEVDDIFNQMFPLTRDDLEQQFMNHMWNINREK